MANRRKLPTTDRLKPKLAAPDRRRQLVLIAMDLIAAKGFEGLRFQEVAEAAAINNATLAYHFANKEELIMGVVEHLGEELRKTPGRPADRQASAVEELRLEFESIGGLLRKRPMLFRVVIELSLRAHRDPAMDGVMTALDTSWRMHLSDVIRRGIREEAFRPEIDADAMAVALMAQIKGIVFDALTSRHTPAEVHRSLAEIARQAEHWLTREVG